jgi:beta-lactam-binding protein with PASTA domain
MKRVLSSLLVLGMIAAMLSVVVATAGAQTTEPSGQITIVNGIAREVNATTRAADGTVIDLGTGLAQGEIGRPTVLPAGTYTIEFFDGNSIAASYTLPVNAQTVWNVVSGYANPSDPIDPSARNAIAYTVHDEPTPAVTVANSSETEVTVMPAGTPVPQGNLVPMPDNSAIELTTAGGSSVPVDLSGAPATSYSMVVAVGPATELIVATVTIANLAQLRDDLAGTEPPPTTVPSTTIPPVTEIAVPDVVGQTEADATSAITGVALVAGSSEEPSEDVAEGIVISQDPSAGTEVTDGSTVSIVVSTGPVPPTLVPVPDVVGQDVAKATETLEAEGFIVEVTEQESEKVEADIVIDSNPSAGTEVAEGTTVALTVSTGPGDVVVPDFSGMTISEATAAAEDVGLAITFVEDPNTPDPEGVVVSQDPEEGTTVEAGAEVVAQLSPAFDDAWTILVVDGNRELTVTGINFTFNTTTTSTVVDTTISQTAGVGQSGSWTTKIDISGLDDSEHFLQVTGTAEDGSAYEQTFKIPAIGESTDQGEDAAADSGGFPWWGWLIIGLLIVAVIAIGIKVFGGSGDDDQPTGTGAVPPPPPAVPPPPPISDQPSDKT